MDSRRVHVIIKIYGELVDNDLNREIQKNYDSEQFLQIVQRLYEFDELPEGINVPIVIEAIIDTFYTSSNQDEIFQANGLLARLKHKEYLNQGSLNKIFDAVGEAFLNARGEKPFFLEGVLLTFHDESWPEKLLRLYALAKTREQKVVLARWIGSFYKEKGLLVLVDNLYSQKIIGNNYIRAILEKYSLLEDIDLKSDECNAIISAVLDYLETPGPKIENSEDEKKYAIESINRTSGARILVVLNGYLKTSKESKARIQSKGNLIVTYHCADRMHDAFVEIPLSRYLSGHIN